MKKIIVLIITTGIIIGNRIGHENPEYLSVNFEDNHYTVVEATPSAMPVSKVYAKEVVPEPTVEPARTELDGTVEKMLNYIHKAESTWGRNTNPNALHNLCAAKGEWNELGYGGMKLKICFKDEATGMAKVRDWLTRKLEKFNGDEAKTLCHYNLGGEHINCNYYQGYVGGDL